MNVLISIAKSDFGVCWCYLRCETKPFETQNGTYSTAMKPSVLSQIVFFFV